VHPWRGGDRLAVRRTEAGGFTARDEE